MKKRKWRSRWGWSHLLWPTVEDMSMYFDDYGDILDKLDSGNPITMFDIVASRSDDSFEAFCRRYHSNPGYLWPAFGMMRRKPLSMQHEHYIRGDGGMWAKVPEPPPPPPIRRPTINPFTIVRRRKIREKNLPELTPILERTARIRAELNKRHNDGPDEYLNR